MSASVDLNQIHPVTDFVRNYKAYLTRIRETRKPEVLTVNGVAECVLIDAESFQEMKEAWEKVRFINAVNQSIESMNAGTGKPASEAFREIRAKLDL
jgi:PHD/YefM family antitoxin component YafN of YafNO toxin-antitoxin module